MRILLATTLVVLAVAAGSVAACAGDKNGQPARSGASAPAAAGSSASTTGNLTTGCVKNYDPAIDYFPDKTTLEFIRNFSVTYHKSYKLVTARASVSDSALPEKFVLVLCGTPRPDLSGDLAGATVVQIPIASMFALSLTHMPLLDDLNRVEVLTGIGRGATVNTPSVRERIAAGKVIDFAQTPQIVNAELIISHAPGIMMVSASDNPNYNVVRNAGIPVVPNTEYLEPTPLGRVEWIKYMGLFLNEERRAQERFARVRDDYQALVGRTSRIPEESRPLVMTGNASRGVFNISGGRSFIARLIQDAGGRYVWSDNESVGSARVELESQLARASKADIWMNLGSWKHLGDMIAEEPRYAEFNAYRRGQVWANNRRVNEGGGNDYWERGLSRPDLLLADVVKILHPELVPNHELHWYRQVPPQ
jgi:iron complex transport system substrate-binding protein